MTGMIPAARPLIGDEERAAVDRVLRSGMIARGPEVAAFEEEFGAQVVDGRTCVAVNSGTAGSHLGLLAAGVGPGDEVIVPSFTFAATANSVALTGATPVFVDIEPDYFCIDPQPSKPRSPLRTKGIMPVHLYGHPAAMTALGEIAARHGLAVYEDAAQAHGGGAGRAAVGTFGEFAMFSFYPTKNMTSGEGGMVSCDDDALARSVRLLAQPGHGDAVRERGRRVQHPHDRRPRRHRQGPAGEALRAGPSSARRTPPSWTRTCAGSSPRRSHRAQRTSTTSTRSGCGQDRDAFVAALAGAGVGQRGLLPDPQPPPALASTSTLDLPETERAAARSSRCPSIRRCPPTTWRRSSRPSTPSRRRVPDGNAAGRDSSAWA